MLAPVRPATPVPALRADALPPAVRAAAAALAADGEAGFLYDPEVAAARAARLRRALPDWVDVAFAAKANGYAPVLAALAPEVDGFEIASVVELDAALAASRVARRPARVLAAGPGKTRTLLDALVGAGAEAINVESALELERVAAAARRAARRARVALRVNPERVAVAGSLTMAGVASPFGIPERDVPGVLARARALPEVDVVGFHVHAVSGNLDARRHVDHVARCLDLACGLAAAHGVDLRLVDAGGGLGVSFGGGPELDAEELGRGLAGLAPPPGVRLVLEPGRWLAAPCGWYAAGVTDIKADRGATFAVLRGGIGHFALPASWDLVHRVAIVPVDRWEDGPLRPEVRSTTVSVVGELCTPEDALAHGVAVPRLRAGDVLVFPDAGAYGWEFSLPRFLGHPPARRLVLLSHAGPAPRQGALLP